MSRNNLWQICHNGSPGNGRLTEALVETIRRRGLTSKQVAKDLAVSTERVRNWYYKGTGMTAFDLLRLMGQYDFIRNFVDEMLAEYGCR